MATPKIQSTRNYRLFKRSADNRILRQPRHKRLFQSMKQYGFLPAYPIVCCRNGDKHLVVKDGQHRLAFAESLNLPVYWVEDNSDFDIATVNSTPVNWVVADYALKYAANGVQAYQQVLDFAEQHGVPVGIAASLLAGTTSWGNCKTAFISGTFKVKDRAWADAVAGMYVAMSGLAPVMKNVRFLQACMACCRVEDFDAKRLLQNAQRCRDKLAAYSNKEAYLDMLEEVYNFGRAKLFGLKAAATMAMRDRNAVEVKRRSKK